MVWFVVGGVGFVDGFGLLWVRWVCLLCLMVWFWVVVVCVWVVLLSRFFGLVWIGYFV